MPAEGFARLLKRVGGARDVTSAEPGDVIDEHGNEDRVLNDKDARSRAQSTAGFCCSLGHAKGPPSSQVPFDSIFELRHLRCVNRQSEVWVWITFGAASSS